MNKIDKLEKKFGGLAIHNLTLILVASQALCFLLSLKAPSFTDALVLTPESVKQGQVWRLITFMIVPPATNPIFAFFAVYIFYLMGTALEQEWTVFKYNLYLFIAYSLTIVSVFSGPVPTADNVYIQSSVFLAFAFLFPEFEFLLFFILPVKVKYLACFTWFIYGVQFLSGPTSQRIMIIASTVNFFVFFGQDLICWIKDHARKREFEKKVEKKNQQSIHECNVCHTTEKNDGDLEFRVCSKCSNGQEYCLKHIKNHEHV